MPKYNTSFELSLSDMELIEAALRNSEKEGSNQAKAGSVADSTAIHDLLGRLHNQKTFFRPDGTYVSG